MDDENNDRASLNDGKPQKKHENCDQCGDCDDFASKFGTPPDPTDPQALLHYLHERIMDRSLSGKKALQIAYAAGKISSLIRLDAILKSVAAPPGKSPSLSPGLEGIEAVKVLNPENFKVPPVNKARSDFLKAALKADPNTPEQIRELLDDPDLIVLDTL